MSLTRKYFSNSETARLAPRRPVLAQEARVLVQDVFRCFASSAVAIPQAEQVQAAHGTNSE